MNKQYQKWAGFLFIAGAVLVNIPYTLLIVNFNYPDILREPSGDILTQFQAGGSGLILTWLAFAWVGFPIFIGVLMLGKILEGEDRAFASTATVFGIISLIAQIIGLARWVFVVPQLAAQYTDPTATEGSRAAIEIAFQVVHQFGGVLLGEHIGQFFAVAWMFTTSLIMLKSPLFKPWMGWFGIAASAVYLSAQTELLATSISSFPVVPEAGLVGSLLWLAWMIMMGVQLGLPARALSDYPAEKLS